MSKMTLILVCSIKIVFQKYNLLLYTKLLAKKGLTIKVCFLLKSICLRHFID